MEIDFPALFFNLMYPVPFFIDSLKATLIVLLVTTFVVLFAGLMAFMVGAVKSVVEVTLVAFTAVSVAHTLLRLIITMLKTISIAKKNFILILTPPDPKTTHNIFNSLII